MMLKHSNWLLNVGNACHLTTEDVSHHQPSVAVNVNHLIVGCVCVCVRQIKSEMPNAASMLADLRGDGETRFKIMTISDM